MAASMKYIVCEKPGHFSMKEQNVPAIGDDDVLLKIKNIGICGTDLHAFAGTQAFFQYPRILGHELGSQVLETGSNITHVKTGDKVVFMPYMSCGTCIACRHDKTNTCKNIRVLGVHADGGMREKFAVPGRLVHPVNDLTYDEIATIEPLAIGARALRRADLQVGEFTVVVGCGPIGLGLMTLAKIRGARVIAIDTIDQRLRFAQDKIGIEHVINALNNPIESVNNITSGDLATCVFDATGNKKALESGVDYMAHGGRYIMVGLSKGDLTYHHPTIHSKETTLMCCRNASWDDFHQVINVIRSGQFPTEDYITHRVPFDDMIEHFDGWLDPSAGVIKAMVIL
jgi:2-desacetyl-2-hydroxyethyl bacteriochlorophyllide A dehydrogenase